MTQKWQDLPVKWIKEDNLHIALVFLGFVENDILPEICQKTVKATLETNSFDLEFEKIELFPVEDPRMIVLIGKTNNELRDLVNNIEKELGVSNVAKKTFAPHITLGRIRKNKWEELDEIPRIEEKFLVNMSVESVEIVANNFEKGKNNYTTIESCFLV